jgi:hypothetical protein
MAVGIETGTGTPFAKFVNLGDRLIGAFGSHPRECTRQAINFETRKPAWKSEGVPLKEEVLWLIAMPGTTAALGNPDSGYTPIEPGTKIRFAVSGFKWGQVIDGRKNLPAHAGFRAGQLCSGDVYTVELVGWSAETKNPSGAQAAGFTVVEGRIVLKTQDEKDKYVLAQSRNGGNTNPAKDLAITIRRVTPDEKAWEQLADEMYLAKPWLQAAANAPAAGDGDAYDPGNEPF